MAIPCEVRQKWADTNSIADELGPKRWFSLYRYMYMQSRCHNIHLYKAFTFWWVVSHCTCAIYTPVHVHVHYVYKPMWPHTKEFPWAFLQGLQRTFVYFSKTEAWSTCSTCMYMFLNDKTCISSSISMYICINYVYPCM